MQTLLVVKSQIRTNPAASLRDLSIIPDVNVFVLQRSPQPFDENIVERPTSTIHADANRRGFQSLRKITAGKLSTLVGVEDLRLGDRQRPVQGFQTKVRIQIRR